MKCPACFNELKLLQVGNLSVDACQGGCGGIWFDAFELQRVDDAQEEAGERLLDIQRDPRIVVDLARKRDCPRCPDIKLKRHFFSAKRQIEVDQCPNCGGYWLDAGELDKIREEKTETAAQENAPRNISSEMIRYLYRLKIGEQKTT
jgi:Zn-finger nucleic acid-binding protein